MVIAVACSLLLAFPSRDASETVEAWPCVGRSVTTLVMARGPNRADLGDILVERGCESP